jgi:hypothetical protein
MTKSANTTVSHTGQRLERRVRALVSFFEPALVSVYFWWAICLTCAAIFDLSDRHNLTPDGLSYLDMATEALRSGPAALLNGLWSPAYPALLSVALAIFHPSPDKEIPLAYFLNFLIFALTLWAFTFFLRQWLAYADTLGLSGNTYKRYFVPFSFCTFLLFMLQDSNLRSVHPDLLAAAIVFFTAGLTCRISVPGSSSKHFVTLGVALGLGYYAKAALFPLGLILLGGLLVYPPSRQVSRWRLLLSLAVFLLVVAPLAICLSEQAGHFTFGEASKLNYVWHVNEEEPWVDLTGPHAVNPAHPPRTLMETPLILEFGSPVKGTVPLWYDPTYWYAGAGVRFHLGRQIAAIESNLEEYREICDQWRVFFGGAAVLWILVACSAGFSNIRRAAWIFAWPLISMSMYVPVHVEYRYVAAFCVLPCLASYGVLLPRVNSQVAMAVCATVAGAMFIPFAGNMAIVSAQTIKDLLRPQNPSYEIVALGLRDLGVQDGDSVAVVGWPFGPTFAHYGRLRVIAAIMGTDQFWNLSPLELESVEQRLKGAGIKAVVARNKPRNSTPANWHDIKISDSSRYSVLLLSEPPP